MPEAVKHAVSVTLMGPPRITVSDPDTPAGGEVERIKDDPDVLRLLALLILSRFNPDPTGLPALPPGPTYDVDRKWLARNLDPALFAQDEKRARDKFSYALKKLDKALTIRVKGDGTREYQLLEVRLGGLQIDVRKMLVAARQIQDDANQDTVIALGKRRLLDGADDAFGDTTVFAPLRAALDDIYLDALARKIAGLLLILETAMAVRDFEQANRARGSALPLIDLAQARLAALGSPHPLAERFEALHARAERLLPPGDAASPRHAIPRRITRFIGRETQKSRLKTLLGAEQVVTITGMGGCGKTRLALQSAAEHAERTASDAWLVELAGVTAPAVIPQAIANALNLPEPKQKTYVEALTERLRMSPALLVLDNCEHLLTDCAFLVETLTQACPALTILATSRQQLNIEGECLLRLPPLQVPPTEETALDPADPLGALMRYDAARLFIDRIGLNQDFVLLPEHAAAIASICVGLDGIPLALELAAARAASFSLTEIDELLTDRFKVLTNGRATALPRHKTLRAVIDWSFDLLTEREQILLCRCSVFAGGWTLDAARSVGAGGEIAEADVPDLLTRLIDKSLVTAETTTSPGRYRMLETVRHYATDRLREVGERDATRQRHRNFFLALAEDAGAHLTGPEPGARLDRLEQEGDNLRAALEGRADEQALRLACALYRFWQIRSHFLEGRRWLEREWDDAAGLPTALRAEASIGAAALAQGQGDLLAAKRLGEQGLDLWRAAGNADGVADAHSQLGVTGVLQGDYEEGRRQYRACLTLSLASGYEEGMADAYQGLGRLADLSSDPDEAREHFAAALPLRRKLGNIGKLGSLLLFMGLHELGRNRHDEARALMDESLALQTRLGATQRIGQILFTLAELARIQGDYPQARGYGEQCLSVMHSVGDTLGATSATNGLAMVAYEQGDYPAAEASFERTYTMMRALGNERHAAAILLNAAGAAGKQGKADRARAMFQEALAQLRGFDAWQWIGAGLDEFGQCEAEQGLNECAVTLLAAAAVLFEQTGYLQTDAERARTDKALSELKRALGDAVFASAHDAGRAMTKEQAVAYALALPGDEPA